MGCGYRPPGRCMVTEGPSLPRFHEQGWCTPFADCVFCRGTDPQMGSLPPQEWHLPACNLSTLSYLCVLRPYPQDGHPAVGFTAAPGLYICTAHSGVTLAPYVAKLAAQEVRMAGVLACCVFGLLSQVYLSCHVRVTPGDTLGHQ